MEFKGVKSNEVYTLTVKSGKAQSILVEKTNSWERKFYQRGQTGLGLTMNEAIFEEAVLAICQKKLLSWMELYDAIWDDKKYGEELLQKIFENHLK